MGGGTLQLVAYGGQDTYNRTRIKFFDRFIEDIQVSQWSVLINLC